jgi:hypothetical protein
MRLSTWNARLLGLGGAAIALAIASCTLIIERRSTQCDSDADCASFSRSACDTSRHVCVDVTCASGDCVCDPQTPTEILNACPKRPCTPFDNGRVGGLGKDGGVPEPEADAGTPPDPSYDCGAGGSGTGGGGTGGAPALPPCEEAGTDPLYIVGPDSIKPLLVWVAELYAKDHSTRVIFQANSSCTAVKIMYVPSEALEYGDTPFKTWYYDGLGQEHLCTVQSAGTRPHIGLSDVYAQTCGYNTSGTDQTVLDTPGPVQAMGFVVPKSSKSQQKSISAEAAYMIYGLGAEAAGVEPWTDTKYVFQRSKSSGTQRLMATTLGLDPASFHGTTNNGSDHEAALVGCSPEPDKTLGILAVDYVQHGFQPIRLLAYQHYKQDCAYFPDSSETANDKQNVRDGRYFIWGAIHMLTRKDNVSTKATEMINYVSGIVPPPPDEPIDIFQSWADAHLVPQCAMRVTRSSDSGPLASYAPPISCYCKYDEATRGKSDCPTCKSASDCPSDRPACSPFGYCEPQ